MGLQWVAVTDLYRDVVENAKQFFIQIIAVFITCMLNQQWREALCIPSYAFFSFTSLLSLNNSDCLHLVHQVFLHLFQRSRRRTSFRSSNPTQKPTYRPSNPTQEPTISPSKPTQIPTNSPTQEPSINMSPTSSSPSREPTICQNPISSPTFVPTQSPTISQNPTLSPTRAPTVNPAVNPTLSPSVSFGKNQVQSDGRKNIKYDLFGLLLLAIPVSAAVYLF